MIMHATVRFFSEVTVGLQQSSYIVSEDALSITVCVILSGEIERDVVVSTDTEDGSAMGEWALLTTASRFIMIISHVVFIIQHQVTTLQWREIF